MNVGGWPTQHSGPLLAATWLGSSSKVHRSVSGLARTICSSTSKVSPPTLNLSKALRKPPYPSYLCPNLRGDRAWAIATDFSAAQHIKFISCKTLKTGTPKSEIGIGRQISRKFRVSAEFPQKPSVRDFIKFKGFLVEILENRRS